MRSIILISVFLILCSTPLNGQCIPDNPSFEIPGSGGTVFAGWQESGVTGSSTDAVHGSTAAKLIGQNTGNWSISVFWQSLESEPGEQFEITGFTRHSSQSPLTGDCIALVNVEWRDSSGVMTDYESFTVADFGSPVDEYSYFELMSTAAPVGTGSIHLLVGLLQSPHDPAPEVLFDQITCFGTSAPAINDVQWIDFPTGRTVEFSGWTWRVKGTGLYGPGPNNFSHIEDCVWVDEEDQLHMTIRDIESTWYSTEVVLEEILGYGDYIFTMIGPLQDLDIHTILGLFTYQYSNCWNIDDLWWNAHNEIDVEIGRWGISEDDIAQFVAQPWDYPDNLIRFDATFAEDELSSYAFNWMPDRVEFRSWRGGPNDESIENMIFEWIYDGPHIPRPEVPRVHINLWQFNGPPSEDQEVIISDFTFIPQGGLAVPVEDLTIAVEGSNIHITWTAVAEAVEYHIYVSDTPDGPWDRITTSMTSSVILDSSGTKNFYQVTWE